MKDKEKERERGKKRKMNELMHQDAKKEQDHSKDDNDGINTIDDDVDNAPINVDVDADADADAEKNQYYDLHCSICLDVFHEPITLQDSCRHTFCRVCLLQSTTLAPDGRSCPQCRTVIAKMKDLINHPVDDTMVAKIRTAGLLSSEQLIDRAQQDATALAVLLEHMAARIPVFIMAGGRTYRPGHHLSLHFFEPRYKILIRRAWEGNKQFLWVDRRPNINTTTGGASSPIEGLLVNIETARFLPDGRANISGRGVERITYPRCWIEEGTQGLWYASNTHNNDTSGSRIESPRAITGSQTSLTNNNSARSSSSSSVASSYRYGNREFPILGYNGLSLSITRAFNTTTSKSFVLFEPRFLILANECWLGGGHDQISNGTDDQLLLCASTSVPAPGQTVVLARMIDCINLPGGSRKKVTVMGIQKVTLRESTVREDSTKQGLWYSQICTTTNDSRRGSNSNRSLTRRLFSSSSSSRRSNSSNSNNSNSNRRSSNNCTIS